MRRTSVYHIDYQISELTLLKMNSLYWTLDQNLVRTRDLRMN